MGQFKSAQVDEWMKQIDAEADIPEPLKKAYFKMVKAGIKSRLAHDNDYKQIKESSGSRYEHLNGL